MIHHTILPQELIFPPIEQTEGKQVECTWNGIPLLVEENGQTYKVVRVISSNPNDFLKSEIQPGAHIPLHKTE